MERVEAELARALEAELAAALAEVEEREKLRLAPDTGRRLAELFAGRSCCRCGAPAARLSGGRFFCTPHHLRRRARAAATKVHRCEVA